MVGNDNFKCNSSMDTYGYLYNNTFNPVYPAENVSAKDDDNGGYGQFMFSIFLQTMKQYVLVVTTFYQHIAEPFSITVTGLTSLYFSPFNASSKDTKYLGELL
ncbi:unnamed protein product [Rotaria sp. Silwood2]|nr:unnamed protein product [Rotaria sp. Silwood2]CAF4142685.1 unnamed protein product [Rotaria sp. Silwood2]